MDHLGNIYSPSSVVTLEEQQADNDVAKVDVTIHRPVSVTLSKEELGREPSSLENTLKDLNKSQEEGNFHYN
jgi:hypothetical protein